MCVFEDTVKHGPAMDGRGARSGFGYVLPTQCAVQGKNSLLSSAHTLNIVCGGCINQARGGVSR